MAHPKDHKGISRRGLLKGAAGGALGIGALGVLAGCENTTTPIGACEGDGSSNLVVPKPTGPGGLPLPRPDNAVTWAITSDNEPIADGVADEERPARDLQLRRLPRSRPRQDVREADRHARSRSRPTTRPTRRSRSSRRAPSASTSIIGLSASSIVSLIAQQLLQPLNHSYLGNFEKNIWPELQDPFYDRGSRYTVPYVVWSDGIGWRNDKIDATSRGMDVPWDIFWESAPYKGKVAVLDDQRDALSMPIQRDAMRDGPPSGRQHRGREGRRPGRQGSRPADRHRQRQGRDHRLPDAARGQDLAPPVVVG